MNELNRLNKLSQGIRRICPEGKVSVILDTTKDGIRDIVDKARKKNIKVTILVQESNYSVEVTIRGVDFVAMAID